MSSDNRSESTEITVRRNVNSLHRGSVLHITVCGVTGLPQIGGRLKSSFLAEVAYGNELPLRTAKAKVRDGSIEWNQKLGAITISGNSSLTLTVVAVRFMQPILRVAACEIEPEYICTLGENEVSRITESNGIWNPLLGNLRGVMDILDGVAQIHPYAKMAWSILSVMPKAVQQQVERDGKFRGLLTDLEQIMLTLRETEDLQTRCRDEQQAAIISRILQQVSECGFFIQQYTKDMNFSLSCSARK
ncbi:hypothetical protein K488DRAFT_73268 [Vararia minispora EC-137]|uniref:Uncharacterized protein n=1 Tax=Vararia minispora EC-137 TaxID=1314806 RepID=A0ACB8QBL9_9AGAM|nr:hypothetical protein K488DRAFT_73268 [Vararia minispora EC-137]